MANTRTCSSASEMASIVHYCQARPAVSGTVARVGENGVRSHLGFDDGGSGAVCDRPFIGINRYVRSVLGDFRTVSGSC
ncbi:hypothetical protein [Microcoleus sp. F4-D5]|uniref:hypothetical protein n=1 Tax=Microcoleus sp. F4-D5 TaxID=2818760 RepID=UPI002FD733D0